MNVTSEGEGKNTKFNVALTSEYLAKSAFYTSNAKYVIVTYSATLNKYAVKGTAVTLMRMLNLNTVMIQVLTVFRAIRYMFTHMDLRYSNLTKQAIRLQVQPLTCITISSYQCYWNGYIR